MIATLRGLLALALLVGLYAIPVTLGFAFLAIATFAANSTTVAESVFLTVTMLPTIGFTSWALLYVVLTTNGTTGTFLGASAPVSQEAAPELWQRVTYLAGRVGTRLPDELLLTAQANAGVMEETRWLGLVPGPRRMYLGLPLLATFPQAYVDAAICHELGHYAGGHARVGALCCRADSAAEVMEKRFALMSARSGRRALLIKCGYRLLISYRSLYRRLSFAARRRQEYHADKQAAAVAGYPQTAEALCCVHGVQAAWAAFLARTPPTRWDPTESDQAESDQAESDQAESDPFEDFRRDCRTVEALQDAWWGAARGKERAGRFDSHPSLSERLAGLRQPAMVTQPMNTEGTPPVNPVMPALPLSDSERAALLRDELRASRERDRKGGPVVATVPKDVKAITRAAAKLANARPGAAIAAAVIVLTAMALGTTVGSQHRPPPPSPPPPYVAPYVPSCDVLAPYGPDNPCGTRPVPVPVLTPAYPIAIPTALPTGLASVLHVEAVVTVRPGDTLSSIACRYGTTVTAIAQENHLGQSTAVQAGEKLEVPYQYVLSGSC